MGDFIEIICENKIELLKVQGDPTPKQLSDAYRQLLLEYCDLSGDRKTKYRVFLQYQIELNQYRYNIVSSWLKILIDLGYNSEIARFISMLYHVKFDLSNPQEYAYDIEVVKGDLAEMGFDLKCKQAELEGILKGMNAQTACNREHFLKLIFNINRYTKANPAITLQSYVEDFCIGLRAYDDIIEQNEKSLKDASRI